jgi:hypothetical protein
MSDQSGGDTKKNPDPGAGSQAAETEEERYWREHHSAQPWADENSSFEHYAPAYRTGYEGVKKYAGKSYHEIELDLARDYEKNDAHPAVPWDLARPAVKAAWDRISGVRGPRDTDRGIRTGM